MKKGTRVRTFGYSLNMHNWQSDGTGRLVSRVAGIPDEPHLFTRGWDDEGHTKVDGPFERWVIRYEDDGELTERWVRESDAL